MKKRDAYLYPQGTFTDRSCSINDCSYFLFSKFIVLVGRTRLEPIAIVILSVIMCAASVLVIYNSIETIANDVSVLVETNTTKTLSEIDMGPIPISVMCFTVVSKAILFLLCFRVKNPTMSALAEDHRNDVFSNLIALGCGLVGKNSLIYLRVRVSHCFSTASYAYKNEITQRAIVVDPVGAILISIYIIISWIGQAKRNYLNTIFS